MKRTPVAVEPLWTAPDLAHYLGVPVKTLYQWKWRGEGPPVRKVGPPPPLRPGRRAALARVARRPGGVAMGHVEDRWWNDGTDPTTGKPVKVRTEWHGRGSRYRVRYVDPEGRERSKSFPDRQKKAAEDFLVRVESDEQRDAYIHPDAGRVTFGEYARTWLASQTFDASTRDSVTWRLNAQILPTFERRELGAIRPTDVRSWIRGMQDREVAASYQAGCFAHLAAILSAAVDDKLIRENPCHARTVVRPRPVAPKIVPWSRARVAAMRLAMAERYKLAIVLGAGLGLRQAEMFGVSPDDFDREAGVLHVVRQSAWSPASRCSPCPSGTRPATCRSRPACCGFSTSTSNGSRRPRSRCRGASRRGHRPPRGSS